MLGPLLPPLAAAAMKEVWQEPRASSSGRGLIQWIPPSLPAATVANFFHSGSASAQPKSVSETHNHGRIVTGSSKILVEGLHEVEIQISSLLDKSENVSAQEIVLSSSSGGGQISANVLNKKNIRSHGYLARLWEMVPSPNRPCVCTHQGDRTVTETIANVVTSIPFIFLGLRAPRRKPKERFYANSLVGVGVASSMYHISRGETRKLWRWADYAMIAATSLSLSTAVRENPGPFAAASAAVLPFQPFLVSAVHTGMTEVIYARRRGSKPELRQAHSWHAAATVVSGALFVADDMFPNTPFIHAAWHLAAAAAVATYHKLLHS